MFWPFSRRRATHLMAGEWGEQCAGRHLEEKGYKILGRRVRFGGQDELDLVARDGQTLVFVEVKTRAVEDFGRPIDSVNAAKRRSLSRAAMKYLKKLKQKPEYIRFDVVEVIGTPAGEPPVIRHIDNVFSLQGGYKLPW